jgi:hypothetical protein
MLLRLSFMAVKIRIAVIYIMTSCSLVQDRLCGLVVRVSSYRSRDTGLDSRPYQIF